jgi:cupin fold WbuC family metalloprotein
MSGRVQWITTELFEGLVREAHASPRRRKNFNFHSSLAENPSRFLNALVRGTYVTPHRHAEPPKPESFVVLAGRVAFFVFDDAGHVTERMVLGAGEPQVGVDVAAGVWHTVTALSPDAVCFEVKPGPYTAMNDKEFAPWAPREDDARAQAYLESLLCEIERSW